MFPVWQVGLSVESEAGRSWELLSVRLGMLCFDL